MDMVPVFLGFSLLLWIGLDWVSGGGWTGLMLKISL